MPVVTLNYSNTAIMDTHISAGNPTVAAETATTIQFGVDASINKVHGLLKFDLGLIPNDAIINSATLNLYHSSITGINGRANSIHLVTSDWAAAVNWNTRPTFDASSVIVKAPTAVGFNDYDIKPLVQSWVNGTAQNFGLLLRDPDEAVYGTVRTTIPSNNNGTAANRPTLTIDYTIPTTGKKQVDYVGNGGLISTPASSNSFTLPIPAIVQPGDFLVAQFSCGGSFKPTFPSGWVQQAFRSSSGQLTVATKVASHGDVNPTFTSNSVTDWSGVMHVFRNVKELVASANSGVSTIMELAPPATSVPVENSLYVLLNFGNYDTNVNPPLNYRETIDVYGKVGFLQASIRYMHNLKSQTSAEMTSKATRAVSGMSVVLALEPTTNVDPTLTLTNPADNQTLTEGSTYPVEGSATDADLGNVVTVKFKINNGPTRALQSGVSDGSTPISFARGLTYRNKRIWDGSTDVIGADLAENTDHTLTVWAEDDQGGKSPEVTRKFRVVWNRPPVIDGENGDLGIIEDPPVLTYTVTDPEDNPFTVTEKLNGQVIRNFDGEGGRQETITIPHEMWIRLEPGVQHSLTIEATDNQGMTSTRMYTLTRLVDKIIFNGMDFSSLYPETKEFFTTDAAVQRLLLTPVWDMPPGATLLIEVCNNAYDVEPTWEDASIAAKLGRAYLFENTAKTAEEWGINFRFRIEKGTAIGPIHFKGLGGAFD